MLRVLVCGCEYDDMYNAGTTVVALSLAGRPPHARSPSLRSVTDTWENPTDDRSLLSKPAPLCRIAGLLYADREVLNVEVGHVSKTHNYELVCGS